MNPLRAIFLRISRTPPAVLLILIIGMAVLVAMGVQDTLNKKEQALQNEHAAITARLNAKSTVVYAIKDIAEGEKIPSEMLEERNVPADKQPQDALTSSTLAAGRIAKYGISAGQIVSQHDLAPQSMETGFDTRLREGMRAVTFAVDNNSGVAGFVMPQSRVDILSMVGSGSETKAAPILSDIQVIAVGQTFQKAPNGTAIPSSSITVAVTPEQTQKLIKAVCASKLYLALRNDKDHTPLATVDVNSLFGKPVNSQSNMLTMIPPPDLPKPPQFGDIAPSVIQNNSLPIANAPAPPLHEIEAWSGGKKDIITIPATKN